MNLNANEPDMQSVFVSYLAKFYILLEFTWNLVI